MKPKSFTPEIWNAIEKATADALLTSAKTGQAPVAAFDADGTLWSIDMGESFFQYQIQNCALPALKDLSGKDPWNYYHDWKSSGDPRPAYLWLAQINQGLALSQVRRWAQDCVKTLSPVPIFEEQRQLIEYFLKKNIEVYVVTASVKWAVEPGAALLGIPQDHVLGVCTQTEADIITTKQSGTITYREGKAQALLEATSGRKPFFCSGNTTGDFNLLISATHVALAVQSCADEDSELSKTEKALQAEAIARGWLKFRFS